MSRMECSRRDKGNPDASQGECFVGSNADAIRFECTEVWTGTEDAYPIVSDRLYLDDYYNPSIVATIRSLSPLN
eukprot:scaffold4740_cov165-Amphora_coffeaeformis.AAC.21